MKFLKKITAKVKDVYDNKIVPFLNKTLEFVLKYTGLTFLFEKFKKLKRQTRNKVTGLLFVSLWIIGLIVFGFQPLMQAVRISLAKEAKYVVDSNLSQVTFQTKGWTFDHFISVFKNQPDHLELIFDVFLDVLLIVPLVVVFSLMLALMLNKSIKGKGVFRVIFFIPVVLLSGSLLNYFSEYNLLTSPIIQSGILREGITRFLPKEFSNIISLAFEKIVLVLWLSGVQMLIFLAGLQKNDKGIYEAAAIDGANAWESFWKITLPSLYGLMIINIIYTSVIYTNLSNNRLTVLIENTLTDVRFGRPYSTVLAWILLFIEVFVILIYTLAIKISNKKYQ